MLAKVIFISIGMHVIAGFIAGVITIATHVIKEDTQFEEPPAVVEETPPAEVKVEIKPQVPSPKPMSQLRMRPVANIAVANVAVDLPSMDQSFTVSAGLGGVGGGSLLGGARGSIGLGMSDINVFGLKSRSERVLFAIDASRSMLVDAKGGLYSYRIIKEEISQMVSSLNAGTLFNVVFFGDGADLLFFKPHLVPAGAEVSQEFARWIGPINSDANALGLKGSKRPQLEPALGLEEDPVYTTIKKGGVVHVNNYLTQIFLQQSIDAVFVVTGRSSGFTRAKRPPTEAEKAKWERVTSRPDYQKKLALHNAEKPEMKKRVEAALKKLNRERAAKGIPPKVFVGNMHAQLGLKFKNAHPGYAPSYFIEERQVEKYFKDLVKVLYSAKQVKEPSVNVVLLLAADEVFKDQAEAELKEYTRFFGGKYRVIRGLNEIKAASYQTVGDKS